MTSKFTLLAVITALIAPTLFAGHTSISIGVGVGFHNRPHYVPYRPIYGPPPPIYYHDYYYRSPSYRVYHYNYIPPVDTTEVRVYRPAPYPAWQTIPPVIYNPVIVAKAEPRVLVERPILQVSVLQQLIDRVTHAPAEDRAQAAQELAKYREISALAVLLDAMANDGSALVRAQAAESLGTIGEQAGFEALIRSANTDSEETVRAAAQKAADALAQKTGQKLPSSVRVPPMNDGKLQLAEYLEDLRFGKPDQREHAVEKLAGYQGTQPAAALIDAVINDYAKDVRKEAAKSLGKIGDYLALPFLHHAKYNDRDKDVREEAEKAIKKIENTIR